MFLERARVFNVYRRCFEEKNVLVRDGIIQAVSAGLIPPQGVVRVDGAGAWLVPGLVDIHMHIESSMTVPSEFSRAVLRHGTTTVVTDPHEIANVFGVAGIRAVMAQKTALDIFYGIPSSVPSTNPALETTGAVLGPDEIAELAADERVLCLGEVMNAAELLATQDTPTKRLIQRFHQVRPRLPIEGHCPKLTGAELSAFIASGVWSDHTQQTPESILEKVSNGMFLQLQQKSLLPETIRAVVDHQLFEHVCLVTDDVMPDKLVTGHLNRLVALAIQNGMRPEDAIYCATYVPARHMGLRDRGAIAPGRIADFVLLDDLESFSIRSVYKAGREVDRGQGSVALSSVNQPTPFPAEFYTSIQRTSISAADLTAQVTTALEGPVDCVVMRLDPQSTFTQQVTVRCAVVDGQVDWRGAGLCLVAVVERYGHQAPIKIGFVQGGLTQDGAVATSWAHDHHNLLVLGRSVSDMVLAINTLIDQQGGYLVVCDGKILANARLNVGGILSDGPLETLAAEIQAVRAAMQHLGYDHANEIMSFSTLSLLVSPRLKISDKGLVDVRTQTLVEPYGPAST